MNRCDQSLNSELVGARDNRTTIVRRSTLPEILPSTPEKGEAHNRSALIGWEFGTREHIK